MRFLSTFMLASALCLTACGNTNSTPETQSTPAAPQIETLLATGAYMIVRGKNYDPKDLGPYAASLPPIYAKYGGRYVSFSTDFVTLEGQDESQAIIMSAWPSVEAAQTFWDSPEYREAIKLRDGIGEFTVVIIPAL